MITRHFKTGTTKTPDIQSILKAVDDAKTQLLMLGHNVVRVKLEHESLPTLRPSIEHYRECHVKFEVPNGTTLETINGFVASSNPMAMFQDSSYLFLNKRIYNGDCNHIDRQMYDDVQLLRSINPNCKLVEVKIETAVWDSNLNHDKWWA